MVTFQKHYSKLASVILAAYYIKFIILSMFVIYHTLTRFESSYP